ncbi:hypothetical protein SRS16P2_00549 (plasmid) [Variovorax sp. SRS16]|uniref:hypothetical protein n=1 Tax=Variovorax sp. SRS16 TaxID=282217 RepID=UPI0013197568|nr:hypothetical protein [Variovorax sp. SRS16]VTU46214.1 hypothetical protein SRS16P2_00549 [Variovorax sp. SRS16]
MTVSHQLAQDTSVWRRFWSPRTFLEVVPGGATSEEAGEINYRNAVWLKTYMDIYILRWGALWALTIFLVISATGEEIPDLVYVLTLASTLVSSVGLATMILIYRRAAKAIQG